MIESGGPEPIKTPLCVQNFKINAAGAVESTLRSTELRIPHNCIFDQNNDDAADAPFGFAELIEFALERFRMMQP